MIDANILNDKAAPAGVAKGASVEVRATKKGFSGVVREPGEKFFVPAGSKGSWFVPVEKPAPAEAKGIVLSDAELA